MPTLNPVGHQSTKVTDFLFLISAMVELTSLGATSPRYNKQTDMYLPVPGSHLTIWYLGSKQFFVISATLIFSWYACATIER